MIKKIIVLLLLTVASSPLYGQTDKGYNIYGQLFGPGTCIGVGLDSRFKSNGVFGYSVGLGFTSISWDDGADGLGAYTDVDSKGLSIPVEINAIMGKRASKFEIGLGFTTYLIKRNEYHGWGEFLPTEGDETHGYHHESYQKNVFRPNIIGSLSIGYRLQHKSGFFMKLGLSILIGDLKCSPIDGVVALPNVCLGYTIPHF